MTMKLNLSYPQHGSQKLIELDDEKKTRLFFDRRIAEEVPGDALGDEWKGYVLKITGGNDKQGFAMKQGVLLNHRTRLLLDGTTSGFHPWKRPGHRKRKSVRGCIIGPDIAVINAIIIKKGEQDLPGLTNPDSLRPKMRGPKRANHIRKLWGLSKEDDVRQFVSRKRVKDSKQGKPRFKSPKIQRLITPVMLHRRKRRLVVKKQRREKAQKDASDYSTLLANIRREKRKALIEKRRAQSERKSQRLSERKSERDVEKTGKQTKEKAAKPEKTKKTKKEGDQPTKAKKQKKDTTEESETKKGKGGKQAKGEAKGEAAKGQKGAAKPAGEKAAPAKGAEKGAAQPKPAGEKAVQKSGGGAQQKQAPKPAGEKAAQPPAQKPAGEKAAQPPAQKPAEKPAQPPAAKQTPAKQPAAKQPQEKRPPEGGEKGPGQKKPKK